MKPITDDIVRSILDGVEKREVKKRAHLAHSKKLRDAKVIPKAPANPGANPAAASRVTSAARRVSGLFYYVTGQKADRSETFRP